MALEKLAAKDSAFVLISLAPDVCLTPVGSTIVPIPYPITHDMGSSEQCSKNVFVEDKAVFLHGLSYVDGVKGDQPGTKGGVVSTVYGKVSHSIAHSSDVYVNGYAVVRSGDRVHMNTKKP